MPAFGFKTALRAIRAENPLRARQLAPDWMRKGLDSAPGESSMAADSVEPSMMVAGSSPYGKCRIG